jgi:hypothetical protein
MPYRQEKGVFAVPTAFVFGLLFDERIIAQEASQVLGNTDYFFFANSAQASRIGISEKTTTRLSQRKTHIRLFGSRFLAYPARLAYPAD